MNPILFAENSTTFTTNGIGRLSDAVSCKVVEQRNGQYELEMIYPNKGAHFEEIVMRSIIVAKPSANGSLQPFRVYSISKPIGGLVTIKAQHISYDLTKNVAMPFSVVASSGACAAVLAGLKTNAVETCPFNFSTDVTTVSSYTQTRPASIRQRLGGIEGSVLDNYGGEYEWDKFDVILHKNRGVEKPVTLRYGKNITDLEQEEEIANTITGVVPFWINTEETESVTLPEKAVYSQNASRYSSHLTIPLDLSSEWEEAPTVEQLRTKATVYINKAGIGIPKVSIKVSFINLADTEEYKNVLPLQQVDLCDTITVQFESLGIDTTAKIVATDYDVIREKYNSITVGSLKTNLATTINDMEASMVQTVEDNGKRVFADANTEASDLIDNATAWLTSSGGYVIAIKNNDGSWKELLFMDTNDIDTAHNVLRINENGIGFSSNGIGGPYTQAWTLDGKLVIGGTNVPSITCYDSNNRIIFQASATAMIWNATNSQMDSSGKIKATNMELTGGKLTLGKANDGEVYMYDANSNLRGKWIKTGFYLYDSSGNTLLEATNSGAKIVGEIDLKLSNTNRIRLMEYNGNASIYFNGSHGDSYIDGTGSGTNGGINMNSNRVVFSVNDLGVTSSRGSSTVRNGRDGQVVTSLSSDTLSGICCNLQSDGSGGFSWDIVSLGYLSGASFHDTVNGLVVS